MKPFLQTVLLAFALWLPLKAQGASSLPAIRSAATSARTQVNELRSRQMALRLELNQLASRIETLKSAPDRRLARNGELDGALKHSQELSGSLTALAQSLSAAEAEAARENLLLLTSLSSELSRLRQQFERVSDREARKQFLVQMRALRAEREQVRASLPAAVVPALEATRSSDDPEDLLEQADAAQDHEDKVRRELQALETRIAEAREERAFARRLDEFLGDESIFDEQDRRLRLQRATTETVSAAREEPALADGKTENSNSFASPPSGEGARGAAGADPSPGSGYAPTAPQTLGGGSSSGSDSTVISRSDRASDARPTVGGGHGPGISGSEDEDLEDLEVQRARLKGLAEELKLRSALLQQRAKALH